MYNNITEEISVERAQAHVVVLLTLYVLVSIFGIIGKIHEKSVIVCIYYYYGLSLQTPPLKSIWQL